MATTAAMPERRATDRRATDRRATDRRATDRRAPNRDASEAVPCLAQGAPVRGELLAVLRLTPGRTDTRPPDRAVRVPSAAPPPGWPGAPAARGYSPPARPPHAPGVSLPSAVPSHPPHRPRVRP